jgi:hypothetical protein
METKINFLLLLKNDTPTLLLRLLLLLLNLRKDTSTLLLLLFRRKQGTTILLLHRDQSIILTGDYNLVQNQRLDTYNYVGIDNPKAKDNALDMIAIYNLTDPFRELYPDLKIYTWRKRTPLKQTGLLSDISKF